MPVSVSSSAVKIYGFNDEALALLSQARTSIRKADRHEILIGAGCANASLVLIRHGWAGTVLEDASGHRLIVGLALAGDLCGLGALEPGVPTLAVRSLTEVEIERFDFATIRTLAAEHACLAVALLHHSIRQMVFASANQSRLLRRGAAERLADLICALMPRMAAAGASSAKPEIPLSQFDLAAATGLTAIHVNRALRGWRDRGLIEIDRRRLRVVDLHALQLIVQGRHQAKSK